MHNELLLSGVLCKGAISSSGEEEWSRGGGDFGRLVNVLHFRIDFRERVHFRCFTL